MRKTISSIIILLVLGTGLSPALAEEITTQASSTTVELEPVELRWLLVDNLEAEISWTLVYIGDAKHDLNRAKAFEGRKEVRLARRALRGLRADLRALRAQLNVAQSRYFQPLDVDGTDAFMVDSWVGTVFGEAETSIIAPVCPTEDSTGCIWDAQRMGNGLGSSYYAANDGTVIYLGTVHIQTAFSLSSIRRAPNAGGVR